MTSAELQAELDKQLERERYEKVVADYLEIKSKVYEAGDLKLSVDELEQISFFLWRERYGMRR